MDLKKYLIKENLKQNDLAKKANISRQLLNWHIANPGKSWRHKNAEKIVKAIYGEVIREKVVDLILGEE